MWNQIRKEAKDNWPRLLLEFIIFIIVGTLMSWYLTNELKPETDIDVSCNIEPGTNTNHSLEISLYNKADFAGKQFYLYIWHVNSSSWGSDYSVAEHCNRIQEEYVDKVARFKIYCNMIPPQSNFSISIDTDLGESTIMTKKLEVEYWGETTPYTHRFITCN